MGLIARFALIAALLITLFCEPESLGWFAITKSTAAACLLLLALLEGWRPQKLKDIFKIQ